MKYLLDTDTLVDIALGRTVVEERLRALLERGETVGICAITVAELYSGIPKMKRKKWAAFFAPFPYWQISPEAAERAGIDRKNASEKGLTLSVTDCLIAAVAREQGAHVLTSNTKDYPMEDVKVLSLRKEAA